VTPQSVPTSTADALEVVHGPPEVAGPNPQGALAVPAQAQARRVGTLHELPLALVLIGAGSGLIVVAAHHFRWGNVLIGGSVLFAALLRLVLPTRKAGLLVVRSRFTDVVTLIVGGGALVVLALVTST
jgi:hypothetical protein